MTLTATLTSPEPKPLRNRLPFPGFPPSTVTVTLVWPWATITSGMMMLSGTLVAISSKVPPGGAAFGILKVRVCLDPVRSVSEDGVTEILLASMRKEPIGELPAALLSVI